VRSCASVLVIPRRKTALVEAFHEGDGHGWSWSSMGGHGGARRRGERGGRARGEREGARLGGTAGGGAPWGVAA
jgi:hypothetical protein